MRSPFNDPALSVVVLMIAIAIAPFPVTAESSDEVNEDHEEVAETVYPPEWVEEERERDAMFAPMPPEAASKPYQPRSLKGKSIEEMWEWMGWGEDLTFQP